MNTPLIVGALVVAVLVVLWLVNVIKTTLQTALMIGVVVFALQVGFKVGPLDVWKQVQAGAAALAQWLRNWGNRYSPFKKTPQESLLWLIPIALEQLGDLG
ncbi:MAG: hypothetical protein RMK91_06275 [Pseudanabaenaceae cyanobacterium SKYGB_i_bin29]|nr:hypothetical protein [Pseudanabaenaceae cyanobacterium SKYG29]MDW8421457.1 hypothetical protein [Pseudanabaenaceae cyanobacterium SKYGB_i_bin29]